MVAQSIGERARKAALNPNARIYEPPLATNEVNDRGHGEAVNQDARADNRQTGNKWRHNPDLINGRRHRRLRAYGF